MFRNLPHFEFFSPTTLDEALSLMGRHGPKLKLIAGGTDLLPEMRGGTYNPEYVLTLSQVPGLSEIRFDPVTGLTLGAMCSISAIEFSEIINRHYRVLAKAASQLASHEIKNQATVGGNLCTAATSADMPPPLITLGAKAVIASAGGERVIPVEDFFTGPKQNVLGNDEVLVRLEIPPMQPGSAGEYIKFGIRNVSECAIIGVAALVTVEPDSNTCVAARLAYATAGPTPIRVKEAEAVLTGQVLDSEVIERAAATASKAASPRTSWRTTEEYRRHLIYVLTRRAIQRAAENANDNSKGGST